MFSSAYLLGIAIAVSHMTALRGEATVGIGDYGAAAAAIISLVTRAPHLAGVRTFDVVPPLLQPALIMSKTLIALTAVAGVALLINLPFYREYQISSVTAILPYLFNILILMAISAECMVGSGVRVLKAFFFASFLFGTWYVLTGTAAANGDRFSGLATNPNQVALFTLCACLVGLNIIAIERVTSIKGAIVAGCCMVVLLSGWMTDSDAFKIAAAVTLAGLGVSTGLYILKTQPILGVALGVIAIAVPIVMVLFDVAGVGGAVREFSQNLQYGNQDTVRYALWMNGISAWESSPLIGNGPGAWSGYSRPFEGVEAHNTLIDWLTIAGIVGYVPVVAFAYAGFRNRLMSGSIPICALLGLMTFVFFHFTLRQPFFWVALFSCLVPRALIAPPRRQALIEPRRVVPKSRFADGPLPRI